MAYLTYDGDRELVCGGRYSYGDFKPYKGKATEALYKSLFYLSAHLEGSDYSGGSCERSNHRVFLKQFKDTEGVYNVSGGMGTYAVAIRLDVYEHNNEVREVLDSLEDYCVLDEEDLGQLEHEWQCEAMPDILHNLTSKIDLENYLPDFDIDNEKDLEQIVWDGINECNLNWVHEHNSAYLAPDSVQPYVEDILLLNNCTPALLPRLINRAWSCEKTRSMFQDKMRGGSTIEPSTNQQTNSNIEVHNE